MTLVGWMVYALAVSSLLAVASWMLDAGMSRVGMATRWLWIGALLLSIGIPTLAPGMRGPQLATRSEGVLVLPSGPSGGPAAIDGNAVVPGRFATMRDWADRSMAKLDGALESGAALLSMGESGERWVLGLWIVASLGMVLVVFGSMARVTRRATSAPPEDLLGRRVRLTSDFGPATVGLLDPEIVIPAWARQLPRDQLELVLRHEQEHARTRDPLVLAVGLLPALAAPWNPVLWWQLRRLRDAVEVDCDRRVLRGGAPAARYGELIFSLGSGRPRMVVAPTMASSASLLERRLKAMRRVRRRAAVPGVVASAAGALLLVAVACGAEPPEAVQENPDVAEDVADAGQDLVVDSVVLTGVGQGDLLHFTIRADGVLEVRRGENPATQPMRLDQIGALWRQIATQNPNVVAEVLVEPDMDVQSVRTVIEALREAGAERIFVRSLDDRPTPPPPPQSQPQRVSMVWREAPIRQVLAAFSAFTGKSIVATDAVTGTVTTEINDQPWDVALQRILADLGLASTTDDEGDILVDVASAGAVALRAARTRRERQLAIQRLQMLVNEISQGAEANIEALEAIPAARESVELRAILEDLVEARSELRALRDRYDDDYPRIQELLANIETIETQAVPRVLTGIISSLDRRTSGAQ